MFEAIYPLAIIEFPITPSKLSNSIRFSIFIVSFVDGAIMKLLPTIAMFHIRTPLSLINPAIIIDHDANLMSFGIKKGAIIDRLFIFFKFDIWFAD